MKWTNLLFDACFAWIALKLSTEKNKVLKHYLQFYHKIINFNKKHSHRQYNLLDHRRQKMKQEQKGGQRKRQEWEQRWEQKATKKQKKAE